MLTFLGSAASLFSAVWKFLSSPVGVALMVIVAAAVALWAYGGARYHAGYDAGAAKVQATIDAPNTGWAARLATCKASAATLQASLDDQSTKIKQAGAASAKALATTQANLAKAQDQVKAAEGFRGVVEQPLPTGVPKAATAAGACPVDALTAARLMEIDRRALQ